MPCKFVFLWVLPLFSWLLALSLIPLQYSHVIKWKNGQLQAGNLIITGNAILFALDFINLIAIGNLSRAVCLARSGPLTYIWFKVYYVSAAFELSLFLLLLFQRLLSVFRGSIFDMRKKTIRAFLAMYSVLCILTVISTTLSVDLISKPHNTLHTMVNGTHVLLHLSLIIWLNVMFISQLLKVHKKSSTKDGSLLYVITKTTVLAISGTIWPILWKVTAIAVIATSPKAERVNFYIFFLIVIDSYTDALTLFLAYKESDKLYGTLCSFCHFRFQRLCYRSAPRDGTVTQTDGQTHGQGQEQPQGLPQGLPLGRSQVSQVSQVSQRQGQTPEETTGPEGPGQQAQEQSVRSSIEIRYAPESEVRDQQCPSCIAELSQTASPAR